MLAIPVDRPLHWKSPPRLVLALCLLLGLVFMLWHSADRQRAADMDALYRQHLMALEWSVYETHAGRTGQIAALRQLQEAHRMGDLDMLRRYIGEDDGFVAEMNENGASYVEPTVFKAWQRERALFDAERRKLSAKALGVDPEEFRPITFLTHTLISQDALQLLGILILLLSAGFALEMAVGSGALLAGWIGGGLIGAVTYLLLNGNNVLPLAGGSAAAAGVTGMALAHFRTAPLLWFTRLRFSAVLLPLLWLALLGADILLGERRLPELAASVTGLLAGPLLYLAHQRWFAHPQDVVETEAPAPESDTDEAYREQLAQALDAVARMEFNEARKRLRELVKAYPRDLRVLWQLYQLEKLTPGSDTYDAVARRLFNLGSTDDDSRSALQVYREYDRLSEHKRALDTETSLKLVMRFARLGEVKEAEKVMKTVLDRKAPHALLPKAAAALAQAFEKLADPARAERYRELAGDGAKA